MSFNYQGPPGFGYGPNGNINQHSPTNPNVHSYHQSYGYQNNNYEQLQTKPMYSSSHQVQFNNPNINDPYAKITSNRNNIQYHSQSNYSNSYSQSNPYNNDSQKYSNLPNQNMPVFQDLFQKSGAVNQISNQNQIPQDIKNGLNLWAADPTKVTDWDVLLKKKNTAKNQSDTSWINYQEKSWLQEKPSDVIEIQAKRKFQFPNPYIKYKIIPGVDQTMALDVTSRNQPEKSYYKGTLIIWDYHGGPNQQFYIHRIQKHGNGYNNIENDEFVLINAATGFVVSCFNLNSQSKKKNPNGICVCPKMQQSASQRWRLRRIKQNTDIFQIMCVENGNVLDCEGGSRSNGTNVIQWKANNQKNQMWKILPA